MTSRKQRQAGPAKCSPPNRWLIIAGYVRAIADQLEQEGVEAAEAEIDPWISHREPHALPKHQRCKLCRRLHENGDDRARIVGRNYLLRRSAIDEYLHGQPAPARRALRLVEPAPADEQIERRLDEIFSGVSGSRKQSAGRGQ
jgi:hypothetical protein